MYKISDFRQYKNQKSSIDKTIKIFIKFDIDKNKSLYVT